MTEGIKSLKTDGVAMMPYSPELRATVEAAAIAWQEFCELPIEEKMNFADLGPMTGYEFKDNHEPYGDRKENFDITGSLPAELLGMSESHDFMRHAAEISQAMSALAIDFARQAENEYHILGLTERTSISTHQIFTRFLHYFGDRTLGEEIATTHCDQSGFTFHLFETDPGCQRLDYQTKQWVDMPVEPGKMAAFPAMQLQLLSGGELPALSHRVVATDETKEIGRFAIVCFVRLAHTPEYDKSKYGRLQEFKPGFNYGMSQKEFGQLFVIV